MGRIRAFRCNCNQYRLNVSTKPLQSIESEHWKTLEFEPNPKQNLESDHILHLNLSLKSTVATFNFINKIISMDWVQANYYKFPSGSTGVVISTV